MWDLKVEWLQGYTWGLVLNVGPQGGMIYRTLSFSLLIYPVIILDYIELMLYFVFVVVKFKSQLICFFPF